jgi:hypothetical protein
MPSPFPGIDPYLEDQAYWEDFHVRLITYLCDTLNDVLPEPYEARIQERISLIDASEPETRRIIPDVLIAEVDRPSRPSRANPIHAESTLTLDPITLTLPSEFVEHRDVWIEIRRRPDRSVVSVIEVLSPTNKSGTGRENYLAKRSSMIRQRVNLIEFDLLVQGRRLPMRQPLPLGDYFAFIARSENRPDCEVYAWSMRQPLPTIPVPLSPPEEDLALALAGVFTSAYDRGRYARSIDYSRPLKLPIPSEDRAWAEKIARDAMH